MITNPDALIRHTYLIAIAIALGFAFGAGWALIPLTIGFLISMVM